MARAITRADKIYDVAAFFTEECLIGNGSLLWPGRSVWTLENLDQLWQAFILNPDVTDRSFIEKWSIQLSGLSADVYRLATEAAALYCLFPYYKQMGPASKRKLIDDVRHMGPDLGDVDEDRWTFLLSALNEDGIGRAGTDYNTRRPFHIGYYLAFALEVKRRGLQSLEPIDPVELGDTVLEWSSADMNFNPNGSRNAVLHIFWPEKFEPTASNGHKARMADNLSARYDLNPLDGVDETLLQVRRHMEEVEGFPKDFDMYADDIRPLWDVENPQRPRKDKIAQPVEEDAAKVVTENEQTPVPITPPTIADLAAATFLEESFLREIESLLTHKQQLIFEGPPGSGKTFVAEKFAHYFTGAALNDSEPAEQIELVQFHQSYTYEDFVEGIRPRTNDDGQLVYEVVPGIFRTFADKAHANPDKKFVLIIDEINRGNVSRILGELMLLLEYRDKSARLPYSQDHLRIPENLYIIGTMNSADRSLSQIDYALRRRFYFVRFLAVEQGEAPVLSGWLRQQNIESDTRARILHMFIELNRRLRDHLETDDLQVGHSYFMDPRIRDEDYRQQVWKYAVIPLIREYLYHHRERDELLHEYELQTLSTIVQPIADDLSEPLDRVLAEDSGGEYE